MEERSTGSNSGKMPARQRLSVVGKEYLDVVPRANEGSECEQERSADSPLVTDLFDSARDPCLNGPFGLPDFDLNLPSQVPAITSQIDPSWAMATSPLWPHEGDFSAKTNELAREELEWVRPPLSAERYIRDSLLFRIGQYSFELIDRPLSTLEPILAAVYLDLNGLAYRESDLKPGLYMSKHLSMASTLLIARSNSKLQGFSLVSYQELGGRPILFHNATVVDPSSRGRDLTFWLNLIQVLKAFWHGAFRPFYSAARTQNPLVYGVMLGTGFYYPRPSELPPPEIRAVGESVARFLNPGAAYDPDLMVQRGAWNKAPEGKLPPRHRRQDVNDYCDRHLDYQNCDSIILVGRFSVPSLVRISGLSLWKATLSRVRRRH